MCPIFLNFLIILYMDCVLSVKTQGTMRCAHNVLCPWAEGVNAARAHYALPSICTLHCRPPWAQNSAGPVLHGSSMRLKVNIRRVCHVSAWIEGADSSELCFEFEPELASNRNKAMSFKETQKTKNHRAHLFLLHSFLVLANQSHWKCGHRRERKMGWPTVFSPSGLSPLITEAKESVAWVCTCKEVKENSCWLHAPSPLWDKDGVHMHRGTEEL